MRPVRRMVVGRTGFARRGTWRLAGHPWPHRDDAVAALTNMPLSHAGRFDLNGARLSRRKVWAFTLARRCLSARRAAAGRPPSLVKRGDGASGDRARANPCRQQLRLSRPDRPECPRPLLLHRAGPVGLPACGHEDRESIPAGGRAGTVISLGNHPVRLRAGQALNTQRRPGPYRRCGL
jgi:hypothetical protein